MFIITKAEHETEAAGRNFAKALKDGEYSLARPPFIALYGELGSGKTAFVRGMAQILAPDAHVSSPTYALINIYDAPIKLVHLDLYRIVSDDDLYSIGFDELFDDLNSVIAAEWCENIPYALPRSRADVKFTQTPDGARKIEIDII